MDTHYIDKDPNVIESEMEKLKNQIQTLDQEQVLRVLSLLENKWTLSKDECDPRDIVRLGYDQFFDSSELEEDGFPRRIEMNTINGKLQRETKFIKSLGSRIKSINFGEYQPEDHDLSVSERVCRLIKQINEAFKNIRLHLNAQQRILHPRQLPEKFDADPEYFDATPMDDAKLGEMSPYQRAIVAVLDETSKKNMRRYKGKCCLQRVSGGHYTRAWLPTHTIQEFVYELAEKEVNFEVWKDLTSRGTAFRDVINHLSNCVDSDFPEIKKNRHMWSFQNGVFIAKEWIPEKGIYDCHFYPFESKQFSCLDPTLVSCKYFDQQFNDYSHVEDWWDIPTPYMQSILDYQKFEKDVCRWAYVMGGRLCFEVGDMDGWQVIPFFKGIARSGKSTIITKIFKKFYENEDVSTLGNNVERKFGLSAICDSLMFIAPEVKGDLALEQAEFQSIVSGEDVSVAVKHEKARSIEWKTPGVLGGNEVPGWKDNSGSVLRRVLPWNFTKQVKDADPQLDLKLNEEIPTILYKCVRAYLDYSQKYKNKDVWNVVPEYFKKIQRQVAMVASTLHNFMESTNVVYGEDLCVPQKLFVQLFNQHCQSNNLGRPKFNPDFYAGPFSSRDIEVREESITYKDRVYPKQPVVFGLDIVEENFGFTDDY
jgi:hypothetical protein